MKKIIVVFILCSFVSLLFANEASSDDLQLKINEYMKNSAKILQKPFVETMDPDDIKKFYGDKIPYDVFMGGDKPIKLSLLAAKMGNQRLANNLKWGEVYNAFVGGLVASVLLSAIFDITGAIGMFSSFDSVFSTDVTKNETIKLNDLGNKGLFPFAVIFLSLSVIPLTGIFLFAFFMAKSYEYNFNMIQAKAFVNQYNKYLKEKLGIPPDLNISYNFIENKLNLSLSFTF
ncbi:MAG: hypothetical protein A2086_02475 [Spirochaetes bacterium GWD1_27_9]|nr:MAG: hypothetical protein A2Z98_03520 [Spirochaetes bacterium GWB1_27_13]OHD27164.1 MAG: hypothetical protein A2Y34_16105 [Spirochaetes bacterium GWC1_27_15]OHD30442.1 MAG: hypothetical protein A2086_02475 [Spirochaetes bacterium GWD1_27_9]